MEEFLNRLEDRGHEAYLVGGLVRDKLLGKESSDIDIATGAWPDEIEEAFKDQKTIDIGKRFGTIKVVGFGTEAEITTFRSDQAYKDKRRPDEVVFSDTIEEDLKRRDFTINAMALRKAKLIDPYGGRADLEKKLIRAVGDPYERIEEDYLRALRAVRFATCLDFKIDGKLKAAIRDKVENLAYISKERIEAELSKILLSDKPSRGIRLLSDLELLGKILPAIKAVEGFDQHSPHHSMDVFDHSMVVLDHTKKDLITRLAALFHDAGKPETFFLDDKGHGRFFGHEKVSADILGKSLRDLKYPKDIISRSKALIERHMDSANTYTKKSVRKLIRRLGEEDTLRLFDLQRADKLATNNKDLTNIDSAKKIYQDLLKEEFIRDRKDLAVDGNDLKALGFKEGKIISKILREVENLILNDKLTNDRDKILHYICSTAYFLDRNDDK